MQLQDFSVIFFLKVIFLTTRKTASAQGVSGNLALLRKTGSSSTFGKSISHNAVDGRIDDTDGVMHFGSAGKADDPDPYWFVDLADFYLVQTVEVISRRHCCLDYMESLEVRVGKLLNGDGGTTNPVCGLPFDMMSIPKHTFRCELYGRYVTIKTNLPVRYHLIFLEVMVNKEPTTNIAFGKPTHHSSKFSGSTGSEKLVDGILNNGRFVTQSNIQPHWVMIDLGETKKVVKINVLPKRNFKENFKKIIMTIGNDATDNGKHNGRIGYVHDLSQNFFSTSIYMMPRKSGRYFYFESLLPEQFVLFEIEIYSESMPHITSATGNDSPLVYKGHVNVLYCDPHGYPTPYAAWLSDGVVIQNRTTMTNLRVTSNDTKGTKKTYECYASNVHGKDYLPLTVTIAGRYDMCIRPEEIRDPTRDIFSKEDSSSDPESDASTFDEYKMYTFFNPQFSTYMKLATSCPPPLSCGTGAPGWLSEVHPTPENGIVTKKVCFHYKGNCCYKSLFIHVINCPGMFVYRLRNTAEFNFPARYCFENDKENEAFAPFRSVPLLFAPVGGSNSALANHVTARSDGIEDTSQCMIVCMMSKCRSFNFAKLEKVCEVSNVTRDEYPRDLSAKPGFQYYHPMKQPVVVNGAHN